VAGVPAVRRRLVPRQRAVLFALPLLLGVGARPDTPVLLVDHGRVSIHASSAPLADILSRFAQATGAEVVYEAARPRQLVSVVIEAGSAAEAVTQLLEGQGLNYVLRLDPSGQKVEMLVITGSTSPAASSAGAARPQPPSSALMRPPVELEDAAPGEAELPFVPDAASPEPSGLPETSPDDATSSTPPPPWPGAVPGVAPALAPASPSVPSGFPATEPGQPQPPAAASYPGPAPVSPPIPSPPSYPGPASYPGGA
jgi:hypothetical protein